MSTLQDRAQDARDEPLALAEEERDRHDARALHGGFEIGDRVTVGRGKAQWIIDRFWGDNDELASLEPTVGYSGTSVLVSRLKAAQS